MNNDELPVSELTSDEPAKEEECDEEFMNPIELDEYNSEFELDVHELGIDEISVDELKLAGNS